MSLTVRLPVLSLLLFAAGLAPAWAQPQDEAQGEPAWRYADVQRCLARGLGPHWDRTYQVEQVRNRWGELERARPVAGQRAAGGAHHRAALPLPGRARGRAAALSP
jgi:hypothetical protein